MIRLTEIKRDVLLCRRCSLHSQCSTPVAGGGSPDARVVVVGDLPTQTDEKYGEPFSGKPGDLLDGWFDAAGLSFKDAYKTTLLKCRPRDWHFPEDQKAVDACLPHLHEQMRAISPLGIVLVGEHPLKHVALAGTAKRFTFMDAWAGQILRRRDLYGEVRLAVVGDPRLLLKQYQPLVRQQSQRAIKGLASYVLAKARGEPAPVLDMTDLRPAVDQTFQTRFRLFPAQTDQKTESP